MSSSRSERLLRQVNFLLVLGADPAVSSDGRLYLAVQDALELGTFAVQLLFELLQLAVQSFHLWIEVVLLLDILQQLGIIPSFLL